MPQASCPSRFLATNLPDQPVKAGCFALTSGLDQHAAPFACEALFGAGALFGEDLPLTAADNAAFFSTPAPTYFCDEVTSTFSVAHALTQKGLLPVWGAVLAACQTMGRGQFHRPWQSPRGNLYVTFRLPDEPLFRTQQAALITGALIALAFDRLGYPLRLKWPNDLLNQKQAKAAGILLEERGGILLAGVGVNLCQLPDAQQLRREMAVPAGLLLGTDEVASSLAPFPLWRMLVKELMAVYSQTFSSVADSLPEIIAPFLAWRGEAVRVSDANGAVLYGKLEGIGPAGGLFLRTSDGRRHELFKGSLALA